MERGLGWSLSLVEVREAIAYPAVLESFVKNTANNNLMHLHGIFKIFRYMIQVSFPSSQQ
jgi:hypothetical protein